MGPDRKGSRPARLSPARRSQAEHPGLRGRDGLGWQPNEELELEVARLVEQGYKAIKLRVGQNVQADASRVTHIRRAFGDKLDIAVDAATRYNWTDIGPVIRYCEDMR